MAAATQSWSAFWPKQGSQYFQLDAASGRSAKARALSNLHPLRADMVVPDDPLIKRVRYDEFSASPAETQFESPAPAFPAGGARPAEPFSLQALSRSSHILAQALGTTGGATGCSSSSRDTTPGSLRARGGGGSSGGSGGGLGGCSGTSEEGDAESVGEDAEGDDSDDDSDGEGGESHDDYEGYATLLADELEPQHSGGKKPAGFGSATQPSGAMKPAGFGRAQPWVQGGGLGRGAVTFRVNVRRRRHRQAPRARVRGRSESRAGGLKEVAPIFLKI